LAFSDGTARCSPCEFEFKQVDGAVALVAKTDTPPAAAPRVRTAGRS
jgi:hypothetical protein